MLRFVGSTLQRKHFLNAKTGLIFHLKGHALKKFSNLVKMSPSLLEERVNEFYSFIYRKSSILSLPLSNKPSSLIRPPFSGEQVL